MNASVVFAGSVIVDTIKSLDVWPEKGSIAQVGSVSRAIGGCVTNTGIDLKRLDESVSVKAFADVGQDELGDSAIREMSGGGLDVSGVCRVPAITTNTDVRVVAETGNVVVSLKNYGKGKVIVVNFRLEHLVMTSLPNVVEGDFSNELWRLYDFAAKTAGVERIVTRDDVGLVITEHPMGDGKTLVCVLNTHDKPVCAKIGVKGTVGHVWNGTYADGRLSVRNNDGCIFTVEK